MELQHVDADHTLIQANIDGETHIELPENYQSFPGAGQTQQIVVRNGSSRNWNTLLTETPQDIGLEQSMISPCG